MAHEERFLVDGREVVLTPAVQVRCDGGNGPLGHPMEYMTLVKDGTVTCKYCGRRYVHTGSAEAQAVRREGQAYAA